MNRFHSFINMFKNTNGQALIELMLAIGLAAILLPILVTSYVASRNGKPQQEQRMQAINLLKQTEEAVRSDASSNWNNFNINGTFHTYIASNSAWSLASGSATTNGITQQVVISNVYRNSQGFINATNSGTLDPSTKQVGITISWTKPYTSSLYSTMYLTRNDNLTFTQTTQSDFSGSGSNTSTVNGTAIAAKNGGGGEVELGAGQANWCEPQNYIVNQLSLPKLSNSIYGIPGEAYLGSGTGTNSAMFINVAISSPLPPASPSASIAGTYNGLYTTTSIFSSGNYVYLGTTNPSAQVVILNVSSKPYTQVGTVNLDHDFSQTAQANDVYVSGTTLYVTAGEYLYSYNISNPAIPQALGSVEMGGAFWTSGTPEALQVVVSNGYAYVTTANTWLGLQSFQISNNGATMTLYGFSELTWNQAGVGLDVNPSGTIGYVAFNGGNCGTGEDCGTFFTQGFYIVNLQDPSCWPFTWLCLIQYYPTLGQYNAGTTDPTGMTVVPGDNRAVIVGTGGTQQYQVVDITNDTDPVECGYMSIPSGVYGVSSILDQYSNAYSYIITGQAGSQFKIIQGGNGGNYSTSGTFESDSFNAGYPTAFNFFHADVASPSATSIQMQVAVANAVNGSCQGASYTFVGPGGNTSQYFTPIGATISAQIPFGNYNPNYANPGQCFQYKTWLTTSDTSETPILYDITVNYSP